MRQKEKLYMCYNRVMGLYVIDDFNDGTVRVGNKEYWKDIIKGYENDYELIEIPYNVVEVEGMKEIYIPKYDITKGE